MWTRLGLFLVCMILFPISGPVAAAEQSSKRLLIFAAASLQNVVEDLSRAYEAKTGVRVVVSAAGSSVLARQIAAGAPADLYLSANEDWVHWLQARGRVSADQIQSFASNRLVMISSRTLSGPSTDYPLIDTTFKLADRIAVGDPDHVPVGLYAKKALQHLGLWSTLKSRLIRVENTRLALSLVARGDVAQGIVYQTDAEIDPNVGIIGVFDEKTYGPLHYSAAPVKGNDIELARDYLAFLLGDEGQAMLVKHGFLSIQQTGKDA